MRVAVCPACGREFGCGADTESCWCQHVVLDGKRAAELAVEHEDCLCPDCIAERDRADARFDQSGY